MDVSSALNADEAHGSPWARRAGALAFSLAHAALNALYPPTCLACRAATDLIFGRGEATMNANRYLPFAGRLLIGLAFAMSCLGKLAAYGATIDLIVSSKLPLPPPLAYAGAVMVELGCGVLMIAGYQARAAAGLLALFCVATAVFFHTNFTDPDQIFHFIKNVVMTGGLLQIIAFGAGALSIDNRR